MMLQRTFSSVSAEDLQNAGIMRKQLVFDSTKVTELIKGLTMNAEIEIAHLHAQIKKIYECVTMNVCLALITF